MKKFILFLFIAAGAAFLFSCASAPEPLVDGVGIEAARSRAQAAMEKAKSAKADVAVKADFAKAETVYNEAGTMEGETAIRKYLEAEGLFLASHDAAVAKRDEANRQLDKARSDIKALEDEAEMLIEELGGTQ